MLREVLHKIMNEWLTKNMGFLENQHYLDEQKWYCHSVLWLLKSVFMHFYRLKTNFFFLFCSLVWFGLRMSEDWKSGNCLWRVFAREDSGFHMPVTSIHKHIRRVNKYLDGKSRGDVFMLRWLTQLFDAQPQRTKYRDCHRQMTTTIVVDAKQFKAKLLLCRYPPLFERWGCGFRENFASTKTTTIQLRKLIFQLRLRWWVRASTAISRNKFN